MTALLLALALAAPPARPVTVVERATIGLGAAQAASLRKQLVVALKGEGLDVAELPERCADRTCLVARSLRLDRCVVGVTMLKSKKGLSVDLEAVDGELLLLQETFVITSERLDKSPEAQVFAHHLARKLVAEDAPVAEVKPQPEPEPRRLDEPWVEPRPEWVETSAPRSPSPAVLGISGGVVAAVGVGLVIASVVVKGQLDGALAQQPVITTLTRAQAQQQADLANGLLVGGVLGLVLGAGAVSVGGGLAASAP